MGSTGRRAVQFRVRFPEDLMSYIREQAEYNCRSMNAEIIFRLTQTKEQDGNKDDQN